jgi:hypothetical protein
MFHFFLPALHLPRASALARVEERGDDSSLLSRLVRIRVFPMRRESVSSSVSVGSPTLVETVQEGRRVERAREKEVYYDLTNPQLARAQSREAAAASRHYFMVSYVHTSHTTSERASRPGDMARSHALRGKIASRLRWSVA